MSDAHESWRRADELFSAALELAPAQRAAFVNASVGADEALRARVDELLAGHARAEPAFLEPPGERDLVGKRVGEFTLVRLLGAGGMGAVYEAEQERPQRRVALKLVRALPGVARDARRLALEAELMARLAHPGIAHVHAAGTIDDEAGQLAWFAMELVEGAQTLLDFARAKALSRDERLALFDSVCRAVQHGHQRGVVHCDLKPANILIDVQGAVKVIDFGIARAAGVQASAATLHSASDIVGTLAYMSPEQAGGAVECVDTRSDVYSLGVVLYELLLDARPLELGGGTITEALDAVRSRDPIAPRARRRDFPRDLELVLLKALAKEPEQRYASVSEFADDVRRFREHEPIVARSPSLAHRVRLVFRRRRALAVAITLVAVTLIVASIVSTLAWFEADSAARAEAQARARAERVVRLQRRIFVLARPAQALGRDVTVREVLDDAVFAAERELGLDPASLGDMLATLGTTYVQIGVLEDARRLLERSLELAGADEDAMLARRVDLALAYIGMSRFDDAAKLLDGALEHARGETRTLALYRRAVVERSRNRFDAAQATLDEALASCAAVESGSTLRATLQHELGLLAYQRRDFALAETLQRAALDAYVSALPPDHPSIGAAQTALGNALFDLGRVDEAAERWSTALASFERVLDPSHPDFATVIANLALVHERKRDFAQARVLYERALELRKKWLGPDNPRVADLLSRFATMLLASGDPDAAESVAREAVEVRGRSLGARAGSDLGMAENVLALAFVQIQRRDFGAAEASAREALSIQRAALEPGHADLAKSLTTLGSALLELGRATEAEPCLREALEIRRTKLPGQWLTSNTASLLGGCLTKLARTSEAESLLAEAVPVIERALGVQDFRAKSARERLAQLYERTERGELAAELRAR